MPWRSFRARLVIGAATWIAAGLAISGFVLSGIFRDVVAAQFDHDLLDHASELANLVKIDPNSKPIVHTVVSDPRFLPARSGLYWQVELQNGASLRSPSLEDALLLPNGPTSDDGAPISVNGPTGPMRLIRRLFRPGHLNEALTVSVGVDERLIDEEMRKVQMPLAMSLAMIAFGLIGAAYAQIVFGLKPLSRIRHELAAVRSGHLKQLSDNLPSEIQPLSKELNGMINANFKMVERARTLAGNFAHALKMPIAVLISEGRELEQRGHPEMARLLLEQCSQINLLIDYQTARARASALVNAGASSSLMSVIKNIVSAYSRLPNGLGKDFELKGPSDLVVACDPNDLTEILGNLIDNAAKWAQARVLISSVDLGEVVQVTVEDDGPGVPPEQRETIFEVGTRMDESKPGSGLGLAIARDLASLYGGQIHIQKSDLGGAAAVLVLNNIKPI